MSIQTKSFLCENTPEQNLELLAHFNGSSKTNTFCTTEQAYKKIPKLHLSKGTLREICILSASSVLLGFPFVFIAKKASECLSLLWDGKLREASECRTNIVDAFTDPINIMTYLAFFSGISVLSIGVYAAARLSFQDHGQKERFELLNREYSAMAETLENRYRTARTEDKEEILEIARKLSDHTKLINASLQEIVLLTEPQANLLTAKMTQAAQSILLREGRRQATSKIQLPDQPFSKGN